MERLNVSLCCFTQQTHQGWNNVNCKNVFNNWKLSGYFCTTRFDIQKLFTEPSGVFLFCSLTTHPCSIKWSEFRFVRKIAKSKCLSVCPHGKIRFPLDEFSRMLILDYVSKLCLENPGFIKISDNNNEHVTGRTMYSFITSRSNIVWMRNVLEVVEKYCMPRQAIDGNMAHALCMLGTWGYKHTRRICNTYCFSTATMAAQTLISVTLYVHSCQQKSIGLKFSKSQTGSDVR